MPTSFKPIMPRKAKNTRKIGNVFDKSKISVGSYLQVKKKIKNNTHTP